MTMSKGVASPKLLAAAQARADAAWPPQKLAELTRLYVVEGLSHEAIAHRMGMTKNTVIGKRVRLGLVRGDGFVPGAQLASRLRSEELREPQSTLNSRLDALHAAMDAVLARPRPRPVAAKAADNVIRPFERRRDA